jgi:hypothetical protein
MYIVFVMFGDFIIQIIKHILKFISFDIHKESILIGHRGQIEDIPSSLTWTIWGW